VRDQDSTLRSLGLKDFAIMVFENCPELSQHLVSMLCGSLMLWTSVDQALHGGAARLLLEHAELLTAASFVRGTACHQLFLLSFSSNIYCCKDRHHCLPLCSCFRTT